MRVDPIDSNGSRFRVLRHTNVRRYFVGYVSSNFGTSMANVALAFAVLDGGGDATDLGLVFTSQIIVQIALMIGGGVIADRLGRRRVMLGADLLRTGCQGLLAVALFAGHPAIWVFIVLVSLGAAGGAVFEPASGLPIASSSQSPAIVSRACCWSFRPSRDIGNAGTGSQI